jgi:hypothetical protein
MKVVFVGPSLPDAAQIAGDDIEIRPPACQGDVMQAVDDGAKIIGLIDGHFEFVAPVWHKELLFALTKGISVFGAASMGALRAAECAPFGMSGIGLIYDDYVVGRRIDDADVALLHGPAELNYPQVTVPIVNIDATLISAEIKGLLGKTELNKLSKAGRSIFFKERTWKKIAETADLEWAPVAAMVKSGWIDQKRLDAIALMKTVDTTQPIDGPQREWIFNATPTWRAMYP